MRNKKAKEYINNAIFKLEERIDYLRRDDAYNNTVEINFLRNTVKILKQAKGE